MYMAPFRWNDDNDYDSDNDASENDYIDDDKDVLKINQSIKNYIAPLKDPYLEALTTQAKRKINLQNLGELRRGAVWEAF